MNLELCLPHGMALPPGRLITSDEGDGGTQPLWLSDDPAPLELWSKLRAYHPASGLWPVLLHALDPLDADFRPWACGELWPERMTSPAEADPQALLARWWREYTSVEEDDDILSPEEGLAVIAPFSRTWPGSAPARVLSADPDETADQYARVFLAQHPHARLGLVTSARGADALADVGWSGPLNYDNDTALFSAVVRDWEDRFGVRVVAVGHDTLHLSVAVPPRTLQDALIIAAEHFAFCPDNIWQGRHQNLEAYAEHLIDVHSWEFWWD
ncbi:DUF4253 domain-containing protein [Streptomyces sp. NPDC002778]